MTTHSAEETIELGLNLAKNLKGGEVLGLVGELGGGKTTFIKGLAEGLRVEESITSPTFVILKKYPGKIGDKKIEFVHIDAYRVESLEDIKSVGIEDYLDRDDVVMLVEWAEKIKEILPEDTGYIKFKFVDENIRQIDVK